MNSLVVWTVVDIVALIAGLAVYLFIVGSQLTKVAGNLEDAADIVWQIKKDAELNRWTIDIIGHRELPAFLEREQENYRRALADIDLTK